jgi:mRNA-degrading endonuclease RelE of RelBE toxin-antitoxin system
MNYEIIGTDFFIRDLKWLVKKYPRIQRDIAKLSKELSENPFQGIQIKENCYKIRFSISGKSRGKSGGGRVITFVKIEQETVLLLAIYDKSEEENILESELNARLEATIG